VEPRCYYVTLIHMPHKCWTIDELRADLERFREELPEVEWPG